MKKKNKTILIILALLTTTILFLSLNITNAAGRTYFTPTPIIPNDSVYWDFNVSDTLGWKLEAYNGSDLMLAWDIIYNVSAFPYFKNYSGGLNHYYGVQVRGMIFNTSTNSLEEIPLSYLFPYFNYSLVNFTYSDFVGAEPGFSPYSLPVNPFIPINGTTLMMQWCAQGLLDDYSAFINDPSPIVTYPDSNTIRFENSIGSGEYVETSYYNNGTLKSAVVNTTQSGYYPEGFVYNITRIFDFNPIDELEWELDIGDVFYTGNTGYNGTIMGEIKYEIVDIINSTADFMGLPIIVQEIRANESLWDNNTKTWIVLSNMNNISIGIANEQNVAVMGPRFPGPPLIVPNGTRGKDLAEAFSIFTMMNPELEITYGDYWVRMINTTDQGYAYTEYLQNGLMKYLYTKNLMSPIDTVMFYKNSTIINGDYNFEIEPYGTDEFQANVNMSVSGDTLLLFAGMNLNPTNVTLDDGLLFIDLFLNDTDNLQGLVNITIDYDNAKYRNIKLWWFNMSAYGGIGDWIEIPYTVPGAGKLEVLVDHVSFFALSGNSLPGPFTLNENATDPDTDGIFDLYWGISAGADNYSVYESTSPITVLTGSETLIATEIDQLIKPVTKTVNGTFYYVVAANNKYGFTLSDDVQVIVAIPVVVEIPPLEPPGSFELSSNADDPDDDGNFTLTWTASNRAVNYTVYVHSSFITTITSSLTVLVTDTTSRSLVLSDYDNGTYYFIVVAHNNAGDTLSNCIQVDVDLPEGGGEEIPGYNLYFLLILFPVITAFLIRKRLKKIKN